MKLPIILSLLFSFSNSFAQWTRVQQVPSSNIFTLFHKDKFLYAGGTNVIYISNDKGQTWDSTTALPQLSPVNSMINNIIVYNDELYASVPLKGVFKSTDKGRTWKTINTGIPSLVAITDFCEYRGGLYAATQGNLGNPIYKLDPVSSANWLSFNNGLSSISTTINSLAGNSNVLIAGTNNNGLYDYLPANSITWQERFLTGTVSVNEGAFDITTGHDTLFFAGRTGRFYMSTDGGLNWNLFGNSLASGATFIANAQQAVLTSRYIFDGVSSNTIFYYIRKDALQNPFVSFSILTSLFTWKIDILGNRLWAASDRGLFFMPLSALPGITAADDTGAIVLPLHFVALTTNCESDKLMLTWKTTQEENSRHFEIEKSADGIRWTVIGRQPAAGNSSNERSYSFTDISPSQNNSYRVAEYDLDGRVQYSGILQPSCNAADLLNVWPNPAHNKIFINIISGDASRASLKIFDSKGTLIKTQTANLLKGNNQLGADMALLANGLYHLSIEWNNGQMKEIFKIIKQ